MLSKLFVILKNKGREQTFTDQSGAKRKEEIEQAVLIFVRYTCLTIANMHNARNCQMSLYKSWGTLQSGRNCAA